MNNKILPSSPIYQVLPSHWLAAAQSQLHHNEPIIAWLEINLDPLLHFKKQLLVLSAERLLHISDPQTAAVSYPFQANLHCQHHDHAGVGSLELFDGEIRLARWNYTLAHDAAVARFNKQFILSKLSNRAYSRHIRVRAL